MVKLCQKVRGVRVMFSRHGVGLRVLVAVYCEVIYSIRRVEYIVCKKADGEG